MFSFIYLSIYPSIHPSIYLSIYPSIHPSIHPSKQDPSRHILRRIPPVFKPSSLSASIYSLLHYKCRHALYLHVVSDNELLKRGSRSVTYSAGCGCMYLYMHVCLCLCTMRENPVLKILAYQRWQDRLLDRARQERRHSCMQG
ncbi:hypothetical protein VaNZ11_007535 [Volvox africanus]|uniref:Uncharacterized protein n=1 Tax=Volvox africanus TaxID=51714 RepID=A0ABQ5S327_9CHLO|nr:hypothetical protein VaNZ11_007535 [Volvox africanus]